MTRRLVHPAFFILTAVFGHNLVQAASSAAEEVVVVYNRNMSESRQLARDYARKRGVPQNQLFGFDLPRSESISRLDFREKLQKPLYDKLVKEKLWVPPPASSSTNTLPQPVQSSRIRYAVLCHGVPLRIPNDPDWKDPANRKLPSFAQRNEAAVDNELALLPMFKWDPVIAGIQANPLLDATNAAAVGPTSGVLMVSRLDGPNARVAGRLVDLALDAEAHGLWGRAYFDLRGITNGGFAVGDQWLAASSHLVRSAGYETIVDTNEATFTATFPASQIAFYAGWYDGAASGPWAGPKVEFMPGAFAYHIHSFSAATARSTNQNWVGPLLDRGATVTVGYVYEPFLAGTLNVAAFLARWIQGGWTYGEAVYASLPALSWQSAVFGDPLYRPFARDPSTDPLGSRFRDLHLALAQNRDPRLSWSYLQIVNLNLARATPMDELIPFLDEALQQIPDANLFEKLAVLLESAGSTNEAVLARERALENNPSPQTRIRLTLDLADRLARWNRQADALDRYREFLEHTPDYPDPRSVLDRMLPLAQSLGRSNEIARLQMEIVRLTPEPPPSKE